MSWNSSSNDEFRCSQDTVSAELLKAAKRMHAVLKLMPCSCSADWKNRSKVAKCIRCKAIEQYEAAEKANGG